MTSQRTDISDLSVVADPALPIWSTGSPDDDLDPRLEITRLEAEAKVVIRDRRYPTGPALVFTWAGWTTLLGDEPELVDLR